MSDLKIIKISKIINQIDAKSYDLFSKRLTETEQKILHFLIKQSFFRKGKEINIKKLRSNQNKTFRKSTLYKCLKTFSDNKIISHIGTPRSCRYKILLKE